MGLAAIQDPDFDAFRVVEPAPTGPDSDLAGAAPDAVAEQDAEGAPVTDLMTGRPSQAAHGAQPGGARQLMDLLSVSQRKMLSLGEAVVRLGDAALRGEAQLEARITALEAHNDMAGERLWTQVDAAFAELTARHDAVVAGIAAEFARHEQAQRERIEEMARHLAPLLAAHQPPAQQFAPEPPAPEIAPPAITTPDITTPPEPVIEAQVEAEADSDLVDLRAAPGDATAEAAPELLTPIPEAAPQPEAGPIALAIGVRKAKAKAPRRKIAWPGPQVLLAGVTGALAMGATALTVWQGRNSDADQAPAATAAPHAKATPAPTTHARPARTIQITGPHVAAGGMVALSRAAALDAQRSLSQLGYYHGPIDGEETPALHEAIARYVHDMDLARQAKPVAPHA